MQGRPKAPNTMVATLNDVGEKLNQCKVFISTFRNDKFN